MTIYGTALLSACLVIGLLLGRSLGVLLGVEANIGGVGIAMLLLIICSDRLRQSGALQEPTERGVIFWSSIYIPVVVAMAASQNVRKAIGAGTVAVVAGVAVVLVSFAMVPLLTRVGASESPDADSVSQKRGSN